jgi:hypothetical protein
LIHRENWALCLERDRHPPRSAAGIEEASGIHAIRYPQLEAAGRIARQLFAMA